MEGIYFKILRCDEEGGHSSELQIPRRETAGLAVVESIHQVDGLEKDASVFDVHLRPHLEEPVDHGCPQLASDVRLVDHEGRKAGLGLARNHVVVNLSTVVSEEEGVLLFE